MVDWNDPNTIASESVIFTLVAAAFAGIYIFEWITSLDFDWSFITRQRGFQWPMIVYFLERYLMLGCLAGLIVSQVVITKINCQALYTWIQISGTMSIGLASITFCIRTVAIWNNDKRVLFPLIVLVLGHWSLILRGVLVKANYVNNFGCVLVHTTDNILAAQFVYSACVDCIVLLLSVYKLSRNGVTRSKFGYLLFRDGLIYVIIALLGNTLVAVFQVLGLNRIMTVMFDPPAFILGTIAATRAVRNLIRYQRAGSEYFSTPLPLLDSAIPIDIEESLPGLPHQFDRYKLKPSETQSSQVGILG